MAVVVAGRAGGRGRGAPAEPWAADGAGMGVGSDGAAELPEVGKAGFWWAVDRAAEERCRERRRSLLARVSGRDTAARQRGTATVGAESRESSSERDGDFGDEGSLSNFTTTVIGGMTMAGAGGGDWRRLGSTRRMVFAEKERQLEARCRGGDGRNVFEEESGGRQLLEGRTCSTRSVRVA